VTPRHPPRSRLSGGTQQSFASPARPRERRPTRRACDSAVDGYTIPSGERDC
jgi:hypothetical protein